ncbi:hypothetical protein D3C71_1964360 [compost metagenome]
MSIRSTDASSRAASRAIKPMVDAIQLEAKTTGAAGRPWALTVVSACFCADVQRVTSR